MYKDKDKQREANRLQMQRARAKGNTEQDNSKGNTGCPRVTDQEFTKLMAQAKPGHIRVSKPGDSDYETLLVNAEPNTGDKRLKDYYDKHRETTKPKRGKDIKVFEDLPPDVQQTIDVMSIVEGKMDQTIKANRTAIAVHYQHTFPERY